MTTGRAQSWIERNVVRLSETSLLAEPAVPAILAESEDVFVSGLEVRPDTNSDFLFVSPVLSGV